MPIYCENNLGNSLELILYSILNILDLFEAKNFLEKVLHVFLICREKERPMQFYEVFVSP